MKQLTVFVLFLLSIQAQSYAQLQLHQQHPAQFISYWKSSVITPGQDERVAFAHEIFNRLLRGWDSSRLEPALYVVDSEQDAWAVSLVDGNILLSRQAITNIFQYGEQRAEHILAFVLAHELAHQRADDLWQHRFFRHATDDSNENQRQALQQQMDKRMLAEMEQKESRADHEGLILMASVGFNPHWVVDKKDFFTQWVETIWQQPCDAQVDQLISQACDQARTRARQARSQLETVASQSNLYQLGLQAMVASRFEKARYYFSMFARDYPNRAVLSAIGVTHLAEAIELREKLRASGAIDGAELYFPLLLEASAGLAEKPNPMALTKRSTAEFINKQNRKKLTAHVEKAVHFLEKAIRLEPAVKSSYQLLAEAYLIGNNSFMARGILQGRYIPQFGEDAYSRLLLALTSAVEGDHVSAINVLAGLFADDLLKQQGHHAQSDVLAYSVAYNLASLYTMTGKVEQAEKTWHKFARQAQADSNGYLLQLALAQIRPHDNQPARVLKQAPTVNGQRLGDRKTRDDSSHNVNEMWIDGDQYHVYNYENGVQFITASQGKIISARQTLGPATVGGLAIGDDAARPLKTLGLPNRRIHLVAGDYLAYDQYGLAIHIAENRVKGWFLY